MSLEANPLIGALGFSPEDRVVIVHVDDVGMCHGANVAFAETAGRGFVTCGSVMVPCPWFREFADIALARPALDVGVHLTLTSEWRQYRWRPLTGSTGASGLADPDGYMWNSVKLLRQHAVPEAAEAELRAQIEAALTAGIDVTHFDPHMGAARAPEFAEIYYRLGREYNVPVTSTRTLSVQAATRIELKGEEPERKGPPLFDVLHETPWTPREDGIAAYRRILDSLAPGSLAFVAVHCNAPGDIEVIDPERAHCRTGEYAMFRDPWFLAYVERLGIKLIGLREIRSVLRAERQLAA